MAQDAQGEAWMRPRFAPRGMESAFGVALGFSISAHLLKCLGSGRSKPFKGSRAVVGWVGGGWVNGRSGLSFPAPTVLGGGDKRGPWAQLG